MPGESEAIQKNEFKSTSINRRWWLTGYDFRSQLFKHVKFLDYEQIEEQIYRESFDPAVTAFNIQHRRLVFQFPEEL